MRYHLGSCCRRGGFMLVRQKSAHALAGVYTKYTFFIENINRIRDYLINKLHCIHTMAILLKNVHMLSIKSSIYDKNRQASGKSPRAPTEKPP